MTRLLLLLATIALLAVACAAEEPAAEPTTDAAPTTAATEEATDAETAADDTETASPADDTETATAADETETASPADGGETVTLQATLTGAAEAPGPGSEEGSGSATIELEETQVCFDLTVENIEPAAAAHIHQAPEGVAGDVVVPLEAPTEGSASGCVDAEPDLIAEIAENPAEFYVNVHNEPFPAGAVRGQLSAG